MVSPPPLTAPLPLPCVCSCGHSTPNTFSGAEWPLYTLRWSRDCYTTITLCVAQWPLPHHHLSLWPSDPCPSTTLPVGKRLFYSCQFVRWTNVGFQSSTFPNEIVLSTTAIVIWLFRSASCPGMEHFGCYIALPGLSHCVLSPTEDGVSVLRCIDVDGSNKLPGVIGCKQFISPLLDFLLFLDIFAPHFMKVVLEFKALGPPLPPVLGPVGL